MKLRGVRSGTLVEFEHEDDGEVSPGVLKSTFKIEGQKYLSYYPGSDAQERLFQDGMLLRSLGFDLATVKYFDAPLRQWMALDFGSPPPILSRAPASTAAGNINFIPTLAPAAHPGVWLSPSGGFTHPRWLRPDPRVPDTMGWRSWLWFGDRLMSPHQNTMWESAHLSAASWSDEDACRGQAGIHARLVPKHWKILGWPDDESSGGLDDSPALVTGIVERFGRFVMGTEGWRAEQVVIRELMAPSTEIGLKLEQAYPDVVVHYPDQGEAVCESEKSSALGKGSRSLLPNLPPSPPAPTNILALPPLSSLPTPSQRNTNVRFLSPPDEKPFRLEPELIVFGTLVGALVGYVIFYLLGLS